MGSTTDLLGLRPWQRELAARMLQPQYAARTPKRSIEANGAR
ncbi:MAG: hypothetical protein ACLUYV_03875 [Alistipes shahii]